MQATVECNGSNSNTITTDSIQSSTTAAAPPENILRNRLQVGGKVNNNNGTFSATVPLSANNGCASGHVIDPPLPKPPPSPLTPSEYFTASSIAVDHFMLSPPSPSTSPSQSPLKTSTISSSSHNANDSALSSSSSIFVTTSTSAHIGNWCSTVATDPIGNIDSMRQKSSSYSSLVETISLTATTTTTSSAGATISSQSSSQSTPTSTSAATSQLLDDELLQWKDMPKYLQFNPYVLKGYRPLQTFKGCLFSLFCWHNETINILTHAIPIVYILAIVPGLMPWEKEYRFLSFCHVFGSVAPWCGSFVYHLFMNIERGENVYHRLLKLDMVGIWVSQSFGALPLVTATTLCFSHKWKWFIIIAYCIFSLWGLYKAMTASSPWQRRLCFALPFTMRSILTLMRTMGLVGGNRVALSHVYLQDGVSILGGAIGAMRIPEKWFPGLVDFYLNSHNIMHVLVVVAVYSMHQATIKDFEWMSATQCNSFNGTNETIDSEFNTNVEL